MEKFIQAKKNIRDISVRYIKGVGPAKALLFEKLGIKSVLDLLYHMPRRYEDRRDVISPSMLEPGKAQAVRGTVIKKSVFKARTGTKIVEVAIGDDGGRIFGVWYNQPFISGVFSPGQKVIFYGMVEKHGRFEIAHPAFEIEDEKKTSASSLEIGRIVPFYPLTSSLSQRELRRTVYRAVREYSQYLEDPLPTKIRARRHLADIKFALENIHFPRSFENLSMAHNRFIFEEFFILQALMAIKRKSKIVKGVEHAAASGSSEDFMKLLPFELTEGQKKCISDVERDMTSSGKMYRLLQGDVGSGKTMVAMYAVFLSWRNGKQSVIMAPTEILARQHYVNISKIFMPLGINVRLLVGSMNETLKNSIRGEAREGTAEVLVGTHSLIQGAVDFKDLSLVVIDEQHKFGVKQREALMLKGNMPDTLVMTATPIPKSLVMTIFGDMDISLMKDKPVGRQKVITYWASGEERAGVNSLIKKEVEKGRQIFVVCPRISPAESLGTDEKDGDVLQNGIQESNILSAEEVYKKLKKDVFPEFRVSLLHGKTLPGEKEKIMKGFVEGNFDILVSTTVIEVGVDVPNVSVMVVENAEMYGLSQLHQLRGRIGRGGHVSYCILIDGADSESSRERMEAMTSLDDGFSIAEKDLGMRGPGEFLGVRQSGLPELKFGDISRDLSVMEQAREDAFEVIRADPDLKDPRNFVLRERMADTHSAHLEKRRSK